jgi:hypothetical protein
MVTAVASITLSFVIFLNLVATIMVARSDFESPLQKVAQLVLVWMVPCIGAIIVIAVQKGAHAHVNRGSVYDSSSTTTWLPGTGPETGEFGSHHGDHSGGGDGGH